MCKKYIAIACVFSLYTAWLSPVHAKTDHQTYKEIQRYIQQRNIQKARRLCRSFLKTHLKSRYIADVRFVLAEYEKSPKKAIQQYNILVTKYRYYSKRDIAQLRICDIYYLQSNWKGLARSSQFGQNNFSRSKIHSTFSMYYIIANIKLLKYNTAKTACYRLIKNDHNYHTLTRALLLLVYINKKTTGYSRNYIYNLRELAIGLKKGEQQHSVLFLLGEFYYKNKNYDMAFSAYTDLVKRYPKSIEADHARNRITELGPYSPKLTNYLPTKKIVESTDAIDIAPEFVINDHDQFKNHYYYSVVIGPFRSVEQVKKTQKIIYRFGKTEIIKQGRLYYLYIGEYNTVDDAYGTKIRLAEEYIINGRIARISNNKNRKYIYGEE